MYQEKPEYADNIELGIAKHIGSRLICALRCCLLVVFRSMQRLRILPIGVTALIAVE